MSRLTCISGILWCFMCLEARGQADSLKNKSFDQQIAYTRHQLYLLVEKSDVDSAELFTYVNSIKTYTEQVGNTPAWLEAELIRNYYFSARRVNYPRQFQSVNKTLRQKAGQHQAWSILARMEETEAGWQWDRQHYESGFEHWYRQLHYCRMLKDPRQGNIRSALHQLANAHYFFGDYKQSVTYQKQLLQVLKTDPFFYIELQVNNTLGLCYQSLNRTDSSDYYFKQTYQVATRYKNKDWQAIAQGNLGYNCFVSGAYDTAKSLLAEDVRQSVERKDWGCAAGSQMTIALIALKQKNHDLPQQVFLAEQYVRLSGQYDRKKTLYPLLSKYYASTGHSGLASAYLDSALVVRDSLSKKYNALQILRARQKISMEQTRAKLERIELEKKNKTLESNVLAGSLLALSLFSLYVFHSQKRKNRQLQKIREIQLSQKEQQLQNAKAELESYARNLTEKNRMLQDLQSQFSVRDQHEILRQLQKSTILTDAQWDAFRTLFEKVHGDYLFDLKEKYPSLSPAEIRYLVLAKLRFSNKEMAATLGISAQSVRVTWHRLRKKLNIPEEDKVGEFLERI